ncbi:MAG: hypothetical protein H8M99_12070 [Gloeobacteraceae cyanobacterium ES-bin-144]|nr:hypothetical protein [Verrucomicrobiales bacterium]
MSFPASCGKPLPLLSPRDHLHILNTRRASIQHAADVIWPWSDEANRPTRKTFALPLNRPRGA